MNLKEWIFTTDHKRVGVLYLIGSIAAFVVAGIMALLMRAELSDHRPDHHRQSDASTTSGSTPTAR
jgi:heme/copper-type cytochrome/quinol oxidase subunit 1